jgi:hypothetical protein
MDILLRFSVLSLQVEGGGEEFGHRGLRQSVVFPGKEDGSVVGAELVDGLAAGSAGLAGSVVEVGDGDSTDADLRAVQSDGGGDGVLFSAYGEAVGGVFYVAAGDDVAVGEEDCGADAEVAVRCIGVVGGGDGSLLEVGGLGGVERSGGHQFEAIGWVGAIASGVALMVKGVRPI